MPKQEIYNSSTHTPQHLSDNLYFDNTMISAYRECPRKFFFRHQKYWTGDGQTPITLVFGLAWHEAISVIWTGGTVKQAGAKFVEVWVENGFPPPTPDNFDIIKEIDDRRSPWIALEMLDNYAKERAAFMRDCTEIEVERPFAIPLGIEWQGRKIFYIGRLDKIVKHRVQGRLVIEHKTTAWYAKDGGFRSEYIEGFSPNSQVDGYIFAGNSLYEDFKGVWVDAALAHKTVHNKFKFIICDRAFTVLDDWLADTRHWINRILADIEFHEQNERAFPKNTSNCTMYMQPCAFKPVCKFIANPQSVIEAPRGYKIDKWEPFEILNIAKMKESNNVS